MQKSSSHLALPWTAHTNNASLVAVFLPLIFRMGLQWALNNRVGGPRRHPNETGLLTTGSVQRTLDSTYVVL